MAVGQTAGGDLRVGDLVEFLDDVLHRQFQRYFPATGTLGIVDEENPHWPGTVRVRWEKGSTSGDDLWLVSTRAVRLVEDDNWMPDTVEFAGLCELLGF